MNKKTLNQYRSLQKEVPKLKKDIDKLYKKLEDVPVVKGKVTKSAEEHPYIEEHISVEMEEPEEATAIRKQIRLKELRLEKAEKNKLNIEEFIAGIEDSTDRQIFELYFMEGNKQERVGELVGYTKGRVSQKISQYLKD